MPRTRWRLWKQRCRPRRNGAGMKPLLDTETTEPDLPESVLREVQHVVQELPKLTPEQRY